MAKAQESARTKLLDLPSEQLETIASFLCMREYADFSITSRACHAAAATVLKEQVWTNDIVRLLANNRLANTLYAKCPHVVLPASVKSIGPWAFSHGFSLRSVEAPGVTRGPSRLVQ